MLRPGGLYVQNVIDYPTFRFARAQLATLRERFEYVAAIAPQSSFDDQAGGNVVLVASAPPDRPHAASAASPPSTATCVARRRRARSVHRPTPR